MCILNDIILLLNKPDGVTAFEKLADSGHYSGEWGFKEACRCDSWAGTLCEGITF